ncbi:GAF domain-containing protein [Mucilaginibacter aquatilis]|uniref:GAF domain-containing protein n=1 Tax=Mucilaginibacter aquatilis TaxID=1517760 RepID=A0A6I4IAJ2_9SPHI|nr:GAF domain-containing protein [Mucilaginibacter aquatilis]MVN92240.1 GAF domain-containing protein [Mucilaginibacter aquatilis]
MSVQPFKDSPFEIHISFHVLIEHLEKVAAQQTGYAAERAAYLLKEIEPYPQLRTGFTHQEELEQHAPVINYLLEDLFPAALTQNEIKGVTVPFHNFMLNSTQRFKNILSAAGTDFDISIRDFDSHQFYVMSCCLVLNEFYNTQLDFAKPMFYDIPTATGIIRHYRILYNADFLEIIPTDKAVKLTEADINELINSYDNLELWKRLFPQGSYLLKGFAIVNLFDSTIENAVSALKGTLLTDLHDTEIEQDFESIFRSIYKIPDLRIGFTAFNTEENKFSSIAPLRKIRSFMLGNNHEAVSTDILGPKSYQALLGKSEYFAISDTRQFFLEHPGSEMAHEFLRQNIQSFILAPVMKNEQLLGIIELVSLRKGELNSVNAHKLEVVMPFLVNTIDRQIAYKQNRIQAVIQNEYTTLHPSVQWKFEKEAYKFIERQDNNLEYELKEIVFEDVYPLYGQVDIKASSDSRNRSIQKDLNNQLEALVPIVLQIQGIDKHASAYLPRLQEFKNLTHNASVLIRTDTEQFIQHFIDEKVHPLLQSATVSGHFTPEIGNYFKQVDKNTGLYYTYRRKYDTTVSTINKKMAALLDERQAVAQEIFPHYYERFKSDGVEHNLYIGSSITPNRTFLPVHFRSLRLWQLKVLCELEREHHRYKTTLPYTLEVTTLVLAYSTTMSIRFRMDEKRFDVDGTYNARFEIVKKRIDKAFIKGTNERITQPGTVVIIYANTNEEREYRDHIMHLQQKGILGNDVEVLEVEELQSISGLRALRVNILHEDEKDI